MLLIVDQEKSLKVFRTSSDKDGTVKRERIGAVPKNTLEIAEDLKTSVSTEELEDLEANLDLFKSARALKLKSKLYDFPAMAREVTEYVTSAGSEREQKMIATAILEALRIIRRTERNRAEVSGT